MEVREVRHGAEWSVWEAGKDIGLVQLVRAGRHLLKLYASYSGPIDGARFDLGVHQSVAVAVERIEAFHTDPEPYLHRVHKVGLDALRRRR